MKKSESIAELAAALSKFQGEVKNPTNSKTVSAGNFNYQYSPLDEILSSVRPLLSKNGLTIMQFPISEGKTVGVTTILAHSSGEFIEFDPIFLPTERQSAQGAGAAITYARRYALSAILGISSEDDDDANSIEPKSNNKSRNGTKNAGQNNDLATDSQLKLIDRLANEKGYVEGVENYIKEHHKKNSHAELTKLEASEIIGILQNIGNK